MKNYIYITLLFAGCGAVFLEAASGGGAAGLTKKAAAAAADTLRFQGALKAYAAGKKGEAKELLLDYIVGMRASKDGTYFTPIFLAYTRKPDAITKQEIEKFFSGKMSEVQQSQLRSVLQNLVVLYSSEGEAKSALAIAELLQEPALGFAPDAFRRAGINVDLLRDAAAKSTAAETGSAVIARDVKREESKVAAAPAGSASYSAEATKDKPAVEEWGALDYLSPVSWYNWATGTGK